MPEADSIQEEEVKSSTLPNMHGLVSKAQQERPYVNLDFF